MRLHSIQTMYSPDTHIVSGAKFRNVTHTDYFGTFNVFGPRGDIPFTEFIHRLEVRFEFPTPKCFIILIACSFQKPVIESPSEPSKICGNNKYRYRNIAAFGGLACTAELNTKIIGVEIAHQIGRAHV